MGIYTKKPLKPDNVGGTDGNSKKDGINKATAQKQLVLRQMDASSNFLFDEFLNTTIEWHNNTENAQKPKTMKFNFNSIDAAQNAVDILVRRSKEVCQDGE